MDRERIGTALYIIGMLLVVAGVVMQYWPVVRPDTAPAAISNRVPIDTGEEAETEPTGEPASAADGGGAS